MEKAKKNIERQLFWTQYKLRSKFFDQPSHEAMKKTVRLESALVRLARNEVSLGKMDCLRMVEWCRQRAHKYAF